MGVRLLELEELSDVIDDAKAFYDEHYTEVYGPFNAEHFYKTWHEYMLFGQALIFVEYDGVVDRGCFGCVRSPNIFTGEMTYTGMFTAVKPEHRGGLVVLHLFEGVHRLIHSFKEPATIFLTSRVPTLQAVWTRLGYEDDSIRYIRRITP